MNSSLSPKSFLIFSPSPFFKDLKVEEITFFPVVDIHTQNNNLLFALILLLDPI